VTRQVPAASFLFVPAIRLDWLQKALTCGADEVIIDLEDAVSSSDKSRAREALRSCAPSRPIHVRVNGVESGLFDDDVDVVARLGFVNGLVVPKANFDSPVDDLRRRLGKAVSLIGLLESPEAIVRASEVARSGFDRLALGSVDLATHIGARISDELMWYPRSVLVFVSAAFGLEPPLDGPSLSISDLNTVAHESQVARRLGMGGKMCIHPSQVPIVGQAFRTEDDIVWARAVLEEAEKHDGNVFSWRGQMVDAPVLRRARRLLGL
jgi:citrate lyase subunit beta/citryl-CoA lyase